MPLTVLFIIGIINALNLIDGMDGLAAGLCIFALTIYGVNCFVTGRYLFSLVAAASLGTLIPFFYSNVRGMGARRHKLFMGDTGSQTLGLIVSVLAVSQMMKGGTVLATQDFTLALSPLLVPAFDVGHVVFFRMARGNHPFHPDTTHIHHRLVRWGFVPPKAVVFILCLSAMYVSINLMLAPFIGLTLVLVLDVVVWCAINGVIWQTARRRTAERDIYKKVRNALTQKQP
jgi:UDP-N-acetylmuramyl pentapeptide phosphotransferase/UDP-N-acetylglucosamine-1-phosphate transferase